MADNIVTDWLRSLNLVHYTQAFLDNGYDDLEICKQIGEPDLDAIGVHKPEHRYRVLEAVRILREQGGTAVYFTLENPEGPCPNSVLDRVGLISRDDGIGCVNSDIYHHTAGLGGVVGAMDRTGGDTPVPDSIHYPRRMTDEYEEGKSALLTYPKIQLKHIIRDRLVRDDIDLSGPPYTTPDQSGTRSSLMALAVKYAGELKTHIEDVFDRLEELRWWKITKDSDSLSVWRLKLSKSLSPVRNAQSPTLYGYMPRGTPPPLPSCPPPPPSHSDRCAELEKHLKGVHLRSDNQSGNYTGNNYIALDGEKEVVEGKKKTTALGKLFKNMGLRKSGRNKFSYKQHQGDPNAYEITMNDDDRIALMVMVKEGKITTEHALEVDQIYGSRDSPLLTRANVQSRGRRQVKHDITKSTKSSSDIYSGSSPRCELCRSRSQDVEERMRWPDDRLGGEYQCSQHRRVHSIGHMDFHQSQSPEVVRSISCSPTRGSSSHTDSTKSTSVGGSPSHSRLYSPVLYLSGGNKASDEQLLISLSPGGDQKEEPLLKKNGTGISKSPSGTSLDSDNSVECISHGPLPSEIAATRNGDLTNCSNSTMSASSETSPAPGRKPGTLPARMRHFAAGKEMRECINENTPGKYQTLNSQISSGSAIDGVPIYSGPFLGQARVHTDYDPEPQEKDALILRKGDIINVISMVQPGLWKGLLNARLGTFRFSHVEMVTEDTPRCQRRDRIHRRRNSQRSKPRNVEELMQRIGLEHLTSIFILNGYDKLETFADIDEDDLNELNIRDTEQRAKILTAAELLVHCNSPDIIDCAGKGDTPSSLSPPTIFNTDPPPPMPIQPMSRDSGFYASSENSIHKGTHSGRPSDEDINKKKMFGQSVTDNSISELEGSTTNDETEDPKTTTCQTAGGTEPSFNNTEANDLELSAEDREVCEITDSFAQKEIRASPKKAVTLGRVQRCLSAQHSTQENMANGFISHSSSFSSMSSECAQMSPMLHHHYRSKKHDPSSLGVVIADGKMPAHSSGSEGSDGTQSDLSDLSPHKKPKPVPPRRSASKLCSAKTNGSLAMMDRGISPSYHIILSESPTLSSSKRDACTQFDPNRKKGGSVSENHLRTQKSLYGIKVPFSESEGGSNQIYLPGTLGRQTDESVYGCKDSPNRTFPRPPKPPSRSLIPLVKAKLSDERIDLSQEPYSDKNGSCGIPPLLVQRYAEELRHDVWGIAAVMEQVRISQLLAYGREGLTCETLAKACLSSCDLKISSLRDFLVSIGLPMYGDFLVKMGFSSMERLLGMTDGDVNRIVHDTRHIKRLMHALEWVRARLASPTRKTKMATVKDQV